MEDVVDIETTVVMPEARASYTYVGLEHIEGGTGAFVGVADVHGHEIQSNKFRFGPGHVLYGKLRPYLNKVGLPEFEGICSTDILPLRPRRSVLRHYIAFWLRSAPFLEYANTNATGTKMPRLGPTQFRAAPIPVPPLPVQERIVEILGRADDIRRKRQVAVQLADALLPAMYRAAFGEPREDSRGWPIMDLGDHLVETRYGTSEKTALQPPGDPVLRIPNVVRGEIDTTELKYLEVTGAERERLLLRTGDLLVVRTNGNRDYVGRCAVFDLEDEYLFASYLIRIRTQAETLDPWYLASYLTTTFGRQEIDLRTRTSAGQYNISAEGLRAIAIPLPALADQKTFAAQVESWKIARRRQDQALASNSSALQGLLARAFTGELTSEWEATRREAIAAEHALHARLPQLVLLGFLREYARRAAGAAAAAGLWLTGLMKYAFLLQMEGAAKARLYHFVPYHFGPFARDVYTDLEALREQGLIAVEPHGEENSAYGADNGGLLRVAEAIAPYGNTKPRKVETPRMDITIADTKAVDRRLQDLPIDLREDIGAILDAYGDLAHNALLKAVYEKYPAFAKKSKLRGTTNKRERGRGAAQQQHAADGALRRR